MRWLDSAVLDMDTKPHAIQVPCSLLCTHQSPSAVQFRCWVSYSMLCAQKF